MKARDCCTQQNVASHTTEPCLSVPEVLHEQLSLYCAQQNDVGVFPGDKRGVGESGGSVPWLGEEAILHIHWLTPGGGRGGRVDGKIGHADAKARVNHCVLLVCDFAV